MYLRARQYDPDLGRFVSLDPVLGSLGMPQTLNRYTYVVNNPLRYTDPTGEFWLGILFVVGLAVLTALLLTLVAPDIAAAYVDPILLATGWIPLWGDFVVDPYFATRSPTSCMIGNCDAFNAVADTGALFLPGGTLTSVAKWRRMADAGFGLVTLVTRTGSRRPT